MSRSKGWVERAVRHLNERTVTLCRSDKTQGGAVCFQGHVLGRKSMAESNGRGGSVCVVGFPLAPGLGGSVARAWQHGRERQCAHACSFQPLLTHRTTFQSLWGNVLEHRAISLPDPLSPPSRAARGPAHQSLQK